MLKVFKLKLSELGVRMQIRSEYGPNFQLFVRSLVKCSNESHKKIFIGVCTVHAYLRVLTDWESNLNILDKVRFSTYVS